MVSGKRTQRLLQFFVKTLHGATRVLRMDDKQCIADVIETALHDAPRSVRCQVLVKYKSKIVPLEQTLEETGIQNLETMYLALCLRRSSRWLEAFELFQQIRDRCGVALAGGILPGAKLNELQQFVEGFLGIVNKCNASEQRVLGQILVEEGGLGQLAGLVLGQSEKHPEASVIAMQECILHILQSCTTGRQSTVFHVAGPLFWSLQEPPVSDAVGRFETLSDAPGVSKFLSENAPQLTAALRRLLSPGGQQSVNGDGQRSVSDSGQQSVCDAKGAVRLFCKLVRTVQNQLSLDHPEPEQSPPSPQNGWFFEWIISWGWKPAPSQPPVVKESKRPEGYQVNALRVCCGFLQTLGPVLPELIDAVFGIQPLSSDDPSGPFLVEQIYTDVEGSLRTVSDACSESTARPATALVYALVTVVATAPGLEKRFVSFLESRKKLVDRLVRLDLAVAASSQANMLYDANGVYRPTLLQALCAVPSFTPKLTPRTQRRWVRFCTARSDDVAPCHVAVARGRGLLLDALEQLADVPKKRLAGGLAVHFRGEEGAGPGLLREFFTLVGRALFDPAAALFAPSPRDRRRFHINPASGINPGHLAHFALCGRLFGLALANGTPLGVRFSSMLYAMLTGPVDDSDARTLLRSVRDTDPELYASCARVLEMDEVELAAAGLSFVCTVERRPGAPEEIPLCEGGRDVVVKAGNREVFVARKIFDQLVIPVVKQAVALAGGLKDVLREGVTLREFLLPLYGPDSGWPLDTNLDDVSIADWQNHTEYHEFSPTCRHVRWFWQCVESFTPAERRRLLFFATSVEYLPPGGFVALPSKFHIWRGGTRDGLPIAHTCFYQLVLPEYKSLSAMRRQLAVIVQSKIWEGFGMR